MNNFRHKVAGNLNKISAKEVHAHQLTVREAERDLSDKQESALSVTLNDSKDPVALLNNLMRALSREHLDLSMMNAEDIQTLPVDAWKELNNLSKGGDGRGIASVILPAKLNALPIDGLNQLLDLERLTIQEIVISAVKPMDAQNSPSNPAQQLPLDLRQLNANSNRGLYVELLRPMSGQVVLAREGMVINPKVWTTDEPKIDVQYFGSDCKMAAASERRLSSLQSPSLDCESGMIASCDGNAVNSSIIIEQEKNPSNFNFRDEISRIDANLSIEEKDRELAKRFHQFVNPGNIPDGHCASCAFNTQLHFMGREIKEAFAPNNYKEFGAWFYKKISPRVSIEENAIESKEGETYGDMRNRVAQRVMELTNPGESALVLIGEDTASSGESVLISIGEGTHWYNAYNDGTRVWFIDSQSGRGFNLYERKERKFEEVVRANEVVNIVLVTADDISTYHL
jgi:hypothetical protein